MISILTAMLIIHKACLLYGLGTADRRQWHVIRSPWMRFMCSYFITTPEVSARPRTLAPTKPSSYCCNVTRSKCLSSNLTHTLLRWVAYKFLHPLVSNRNVCFWNRQPQQCEGTAHHRGQLCSRYHGVFVEVRGLSRLTRRPERPITGML